MLRTTIAAVILGCSLPLTLTPAAAQGMMATPGYGMHHHFHRRHRIYANGLCNGRSHGTGYHGCGTATGGPVGGLPSRN